MSLFSLALLVSTAAAWFMTGLIWFVQVVHYPQFADVPSDCFQAYHARHTRLTTAVVAGPMLVEAISAAFLIVCRPATVPAWAVWLSAALVVITWLSTGAMQVPAHTRLATGFADDIHRRLCRTNWIRAVSWSTRAVLMLALIARHAV